MIFFDLLCIFSKCILRDLILRSSIFRSSIRLNILNMLKTTMVFICKQVTRFKCGGFIFALQYNHTMADAQGIMLFLNAVAEHASGAQSLSTPPVWQRHLLNARKPPHVKFQHREYEEVLAETNDTLIPVNDLVDKSFFFGTY